MTTKIKLIIALVSTCLIAGLIIWILILKNDYKELDAQHQATCKLLTDAESQNEILSNTIAQYTEAINIKNKQIEIYNTKLKTLNDTLKEFNDEDIKTFLSTRTPDSVKQLLIGSDYYSKVSSSSSSSQVSGKEQ